MSDAVDSAEAMSGADDRCKAAVDSIEAGVCCVARPYAHRKATMKLAAVMPTAAARECGSGAADGCPPLSVDNPAAPMPSVDPPKIDVIKPGRGRL
jgi:hypothetical protein